MSQLLSIILLFVITLIGGWLDTRRKNRSRQVLSTSPRREPMSHATVRTASPRNPIPKRSPEPLLPGEADYSPLVQSTPQSDVPRPAAPNRRAQYFRRAFIASQIFNRKY